MLTYASPSALMATIAVALVSCATILDYQVPLKLNVAARTAAGQPLAAADVVLGDGLAERPLGSTNADGQLAVTHIFLWGHERGAKVSPPQFTVTLRHPHCTSSSQKRVITEPPGNDGFYKVEVAATLVCQEDVVPNGATPQ